MVSLIKHDIYKPQFEPALRHAARLKYFDSFNETCGLRSFFCHANNLFPAHFVEFMAYAFGSNNPVMGSSHYLVKSGKQHYV